jgi:hypothetical protein
MDAILRSGSVRGLIASLIASVLSSCSAAPIAIEPTPTVSPPTIIAPTPVVGVAIGKQAAIATALKYATMGDGHIGPAQEPTTNIQAKLVSAAQSRDELVAAGVSRNAADASQGAVWVITMDGTWSLTGPPPLISDDKITPSPLEPLHHLVMVLDAGTGAAGFISGKP